MKLTEHRSRAHGFPDLLLYDALVDDGILLLQDGSLLAAWSYRGPDMQSSTHDEMAILSAQLNGLLRLGSGWLIHCDAIRSLAPEYPRDGAFPDSITRLIDEERRMQFMAEEAHQAHFESEYFIALTYQCPIEVEERFRGWMFEGDLRQKPSAQKALEYFRARIAAFEDLFSSVLKVELEAPTGPQRKSGSTKKTKSRIAQLRIKVQAGYRFNVRDNCNLIFDRPYQ